MKILEQVNLADFSTMRLGGNAAFACEVSSKDDVKEALAWAREQQLEFCMVGSGSNIIWRDEGFQGLLIVNRLMRFEIIDNDATNFFVTVGSGENWDSVVERTVTAGLSGIEALSLIPGTSGATPVQNVGAYGQDISQTLVSLEAYDTATEEFVVLMNRDCDFGYRTSRFKTADKGRFLITELTFSLTKKDPEPPFYPPVTAYLEEYQLTPSPLSIRTAVIAIRSSKLPDPNEVSNNGSFFANPIISSSEFKVIENIYPSVPHWEVENGIKVSGAWLIEQAGYKDYHDKETGMATWHNQPLVLINENAKSSTDLMTFKQKIVDAVQQKFGITLEQEPEILP